MKICSRLSIKVQACSVSRILEEIVQAQGLSQKSKVVSKPASDRELADKWMAFALTSGDTLEVGNSLARSNSSEIVEERNVSGNCGASYSQTVAARLSGYESKSSQEQPVKSERAPTESTWESESTLPFVSQELKDSLSTLQQTFVISDATRPDCPIIYASAGFFNMTGYSSKEVIGRNCRFLQGPDTDKNEVAKIREAIGTGKSYCGRLLNYKRNGTPFWNLLVITPLKDNDENIIKFIGMQVEVSKYTEGLNDKALRPNALPLSLIRYDARQKDRALSSMTEVVHTMKHPHPYSSSPTKELAAIPDDHHSNIEYYTPKYKESEYPKVPVRQSPQDTQNAPCITTYSPDCRTARKSALASLFVSARSSLGWFKRRASGSAEKNEIMSELTTSEVQQSESWEYVEREKDIRQAIDLATTLERIEKNFVVTDPRLPDNPIIFASDSFLELTEYSREEILGRNCRFLQGPETDQGTVTKIRDAVEKQKEISVQLINYTKSGKKFWNFFHLQPMHDQKGELQYFIGVQLDGSDHAEALMNRLSDKAELQSTNSVKATAENVNKAVRELPDANLSPEDLWALHSQVVSPRPHMKYTPSWAAIQKILSSGEKIGLKHFKPIRPLGSGDTGSVHLVKLHDSGELYAMKAMDKSLMLNHNKVHRACMERAVISLLDHPFLPTLYASFQTTTHVCLITEFYPGGELFALLDNQPMKVFREEAARFYAAEVVIGLEYLHCLGIIYRDLKPENILLQKDGHIVLADFDLSFLTYCKPQVLRHPLPRKRRKLKNVQPPTFVAEPSSQSNSFVGTEEYIAPEIITGASHTGAIDWWALGILLYEMMYGRTPFRGKNRQWTFYNILHKDLAFPSSIEVSLAGRQLIHGLLQRDPNKRLGSISGANEIKRHPFFHEINWPLIRCMEPPRLDVPLQLTGKKPDSKLQWGNVQPLIRAMETSQIF